MKTFLLPGLAVLSCTVVFGTPCLPGNFQSFVDLGAAGCEVEGVQFSSFALLPGPPSARGLDPALVQVTPGGTALNPMLLFTLNTTANTGEVFESFFRFSTSSALTGASLGLTSPTATGDGAIFAVLGLCPGGAFAGGDPHSCPSSPASLVAFATAQGSSLSDSADLPAASSFDVLAGLTIDSGRNGSATLDSASIEFSSVPEPAAGLLAALGIAAFGFLRARRRIFPGDRRA